MWGELDEERWVEPFEPPISAVDARRYHDLILGLANGAVAGRSGRTDSPCTERLYRSVSSSVGWLLPAWCQRSSNGRTLRF